MTRGVLKGMATLRFHAADLKAAQAWYTEFLGVEPYFEKPGYIEFRLGDYQAELGIADEKFRPPVAAGPAGAILYWHVDDVTGTVAQALALGASVHEPQREFGGGFYGATVVDPFGNLLGLMNNPHYLEILKR